MRMSSHRFGRVFATTAIAAALGMAATPFQVNAQSNLPAQSQAKYDFDLPVQSLEETLLAVGRVTGSNILFEPRTVAGKTAQALKGQLTADEALAKITLENDLEYKRANDNTVVIKSKATSASSATPAPTSVAREAPPEKREHQLENVTVTGSRASNRSAADTALPIDIIDRATIEATGAVETGRLLQKLAPSFNFP